MGAEQEKQAEDKKDLLAELAEAQLNRIDTREETRSQALLEQQEKLQATKAELEKAAEEARKEGDSKGMRRAGRIDSLVSKIDDRLLKTAERIETVEANANEKESRVLNGLESKAAALETRGKALKEKDTEAEARAQELEMLKIQKTDLEARVNASPDVKARAQVEAELADVLEKIEKLESKNRGTEKMERAKELRAVRERREAEEHTQELSEAEKNVNGLVKPEAGSEQVQESKSLGDGMSKNFENTVKGLLKEPPDFGDMLGQAQFTLQKGWLRLVWAMSSKEITWDSTLNNSQKLLLSDMGIGFKHDEKSGFSTIEWGPVSDEFAGVPAGANAVLREHFGDSWYTMFKKLTTETTLEELEKDIDPQKTDEETVGLRAFVAQMKSSGAKADSPVIAWLEAKHSSLEKPQTTKNPEMSKTFKIGEAAQKLIDDWSLSVLDHSLLNWDGKSLLDLKDGEAAEFSAEDGVLKLSIQAPGQEARIYSGANLETFVASFEDVKQTLPNS